jgi:hypothetical protein
MKAAIFKRNKDVVCRKIGNEYMLIPVRSRLSDDDCLYSFNETGSLIWDRLNGRNSLKDIVEEIVRKSGKKRSVVEKDCLAFVRDLGREGLVSSP